MRVISQNGMFDFPYEQIVVCMDGNNVIARFVGIEKSNLLGSYSTEEKAEKAMEMCREKYLAVIKTYGGYRKDCYEQPNYWVLPKVFQFPKDEDVEV